MQTQRAWKIIDVSHYVDTEDESDPGYVYINVDSRAQLESILRNAMTEIGTSRILESSDGIQLAICLSDKFGALMLRFLNKQRLKRRIHSRQVVAAEPVFFLSEGMLSEVPPEDLMPAEEVVQSVLYFFEHGAFPDEVIVDPLKKW